MAQTPTNSAQNRKGIIIALIVVTFLLLLGGGIFYFVMSLMKSSDAYQMAVKQAKADARVIAALGTPIEENFFVTGNIKTFNDSGNANLFITLHGPKGKGTVNVIASKSAGTWTMHTLNVALDGGAPALDLLPSASPAEKPLEQPDK